jgi:ELWxxDGT repeat protein
MRTLFAALTFAGTAAAQSLFLDLNTTPPFTPSSNPDRLTTIGGLTWFAATDPSGQELWVTDGTAAGTRRVKDIGEGPGASIPEGFAALPDGRVVFAATEYADRELWISDGTEAGTTHLKDIQPGSSGSSPSSFTAFQGKVYFIANDGTHGRELWSTDGTAAGTTMVKDLFAAPANSFPVYNEMRVVNGALFVGFSIQGQGTVLVKSDGSANGTTVVTTLNTEANSAIDNMLDLNGVMLFRAKSPTLGSELWRSDGTAAGTFVVKDIATGSAGSTPSGLFKVGNKVVFAAYSIAAGRELFATDGTAAGTSLLADLNPSASPFNNGSDPQGLGVVGNRVVFSAYQPAIGRELFATDGTPAGTQRIADLWPGSSWSSPSGGALLNGKLHFAANDGVAGIELFATDGTISGTQLISDIAPGFDGFPLEQITTLGTKVLFTKNDGIHGEELCISDGTSAGTALLADIFVGALNAGADPTELTRVGHDLYFVATPNPLGSALYRSDGTTANTTVVLSPATTPALTNFVTLTPFRDGLFFFATEPASGLAPYFSDGTTAGTLKLADTANCFVSDVAIANGLLFFQAVDGLTFEAFQYVSDGTVAGTTKLTSVTPLLGGNSLETLGDRVLMVGFDQAGGFEPLISDGTNAGTTLLKDVNPGPGDSQVFDFVRAGSRAFFAAHEDNFGQELWVTDGTTGGTQRVVDLAPGPFSLPIFSITPLGERVVFHTYDVANGERLFVSDGTAAGTFLIVQLPSGELVDHGPRGSDAVLFFTSRIQSSGITRLWRTDGTVSGTFQVPTSSTPQFQFLVDELGTDHELVLTLANGAMGLELHHTEDGATAPMLVADLAVGAWSSTPTAIERLGDRVFIAADDGLHGRELHVLPLLAFDSFVAEPYGAGCAPAGSTVPEIGVSGDAVASSAFTIEATALSPTAPALVVFGSDPAALPLGAGCTLHVGIPFFSFAATTDPSGALVLPVPANPAFAGLHAYLQVLASGAGGGILATPGLELVIGN